MQEVVCENCGHVYEVGKHESDDCIMCMLTRIFFGKNLTVYKEDDSD
jgi:hypothetical protein